MAEDSTAGEMEHASPGCRAGGIITACAEGGVREGYLEYQILIARGDGLFSNVYSVLGALDWCHEQGKQLAVRFDSGPYLEPSRGPNWWEYFFERLSDVDPMQLYVGSRREGLTAFSVAMAGRVIQDRRRASALIAKNLIIRPEVCRGLDEFWKGGIGDRFAIGLHLRGTDKFLEYSRPPVDSIFADVDKLTRGRAPSTWRLFLATDDASYLRTTMDRFGDQVVFLDSTRSSNAHGLHRQVSRSEWNSGPLSNMPYPDMVEQPPYRIGFEAIRDALLLARCDVLFAAQSNLSFFAAAYNPALVCIQTEVNASPTQVRSNLQKRIEDLAAEQQRTEGLLSSEGPARFVRRLRRSIRKRLGKAPV